MNAFVHKVNSALDKGYINVGDTEGKSKDDFAPDTSDSECEGPRERERDRKGDRSFYGGDSGMARRRASMGFERTKEIFSEDPNDHGEQSVEDLLKYV